MGSGIGSIVSGNTGILHSRGIVLIIKGHNGDFAILNPKDCVISRSWNIGVWESHEPEYDSEAFGDIENLGIWNISLIPVRRIPDSDSGNPGYFSNVGS